MADDFDERFPGWRDKLTEAERLARFGEVDWTPRPATASEDDPYADIRPRGD